MQLTCTFKLIKIGANSRTQLTLHFEDSSREIAAVCHFDETSLAAHHLNVTLASIGSLWTFTFESHELPLRQRSHLHEVDARGMCGSLDEVVIKRFFHTEETRTVSSAIPWGRYSKSQRKLQLATFRDFGTISTTRYEFTLDVTPEEYEAVTRLPPWTAFRVTFSVSEPAPATPPPIPMRPRR